MALTNEQREARRTGLGGSDAASVLGLSPWKSAYQLYREKVEGVEDKAESEAMEWGQLLEPIVAAQFGVRTGKALRPGLETLRHKDHPFILANVDYYIDGENAGLEVKTANAFMADSWGDGEDEIPEHYIAQGMHYCAVTGWDRCYVAVLIGGQQLRTYTIEADREAMDIIVNAEVHYWNSYIVPKIPPPMSGAELNKRWQATTGKKVDASGQAFDAVLRLKELRRRAKMLEAEDDELSALIKTAIADADELVFDGKKIAQWKFNRATQRFDIEAFRAKHPELIKEFMREVPGPRVLRLS